MNQDPKLFVALDSNDITTTVIRAKTLAGVKANFGFKINLHTVIAGPLQLLMQVLQELERPIFADIKMMADPLTMVKVLTNLCGAGVDYVSVNLLTESITLSTLADLIKNEKIKLLGWTVPSWWSEVDCHREFKKGLDEQIIYLSRKAQFVPCYGIILPHSTLLRSVDDTWNKEMFGDLFKVVVGIRESDLPGFDDNYHHDPANIKQCFGQGADAIIVGTPITGNDNIVQNLKTVLAKIQQATS